MPEPAATKFVPHPARAELLCRGGRHEGAAVRVSALHVTSNFTFLTGASHPDELVAAAAALGYHSIALTDVNSLAGIVRGFVASRDAGIPFLVGCRLFFEESARSVLVYPSDRAAYARLCRLLTLGKRRAAKGACSLSIEDLCADTRGLLAVALPPEPAGDPSVLDESFAHFLARLRGAFDDDRLSLAAPLVHGFDDGAWLERLGELERRLDVPLAATGDVHYHVRERRMLQDVLVCIREGCTLEEAGLRLFANAERHLKPPAELARLYGRAPHALSRSVEIAERASAFQLDELRYEYPDEITPEGGSAIESLRVLTARLGRERYPGGLPREVQERVDHELDLIEELAYAPYFLTVYDLVRFARSRGILCQGRGSAANSAVCYCLGITSVPPDKIELLFERFVSRERDEPPDIDVDFEHERREEVIQYVYERYGRERAALTAEVITYRGRSAVRDVGKALGLSLDAIDLLAKDLGWWDHRVQPERLAALGFDPADPTMRRLIALVAQILGFPRHLSQHVGGFVITRGSLCELVPIENAAMPDRTVIEWDKDDIDAMGMLKVDVLGLGMLTCVRKALEYVAQTGAGRFELHTIPQDDPAVYDMICAADTIGVFQIESRAQMSMLPRLRPRSFYDLVIETAIVRPGPIQGGMIHPYLRRRSGQEPVQYPSEAVRAVLGRTLGVPLFQEQAMALAVVCAGFTAGRADQLRRAMGAWRRRGDRLRSLCDELMRGLRENGYGEEFAERLKDQITGFGEYGFPESHAASFASIVYASAWLKKHHPAAFAAALINSQPMGFYAPAQIVRDAREHGVEVLPVDVAWSTWDCTLEPAGSPAPAVRLGMRLVKGLVRREAEAIAAAVASHGPFASLEALQRRACVPARCLRLLARASAFGSMGLDRQGALWAARALRSAPEPDLWSVAEASPLPVPRLPAVSSYQAVLNDHAALGLSLGPHPLSFLRAGLCAGGLVTASDLREPRRLDRGERAAVAGVVLSRQRPGTARGVFFVSLEDETGIANLIVRPPVFERAKDVAQHARGMIAWGRVERAGEVVHLLVERLESLDPLLRELAAPSRDFR